MKYMNNFIGQMTSNTMICKKLPPLTAEEVRMFTLMFIGMLKDKEDIENMSKLLVNIEPSASSKNKS